MEEAVERQHGSSRQEVQNRTQPYESYGKRRRPPQHEPGEADEIWLPDVRRFQSSERCH